MQRLPLFFVGRKCYDLRFNAGFVTARMCVYVIRKYLLVMSV